MKTNFGLIILLILALFPTHDLAANTIYDNLGDTYDCCAGYSVGPLSPGGINFAHGVEFTAQSTGVVSSIEVPVSQGYGGAVLTLGIFEADRSTLLEEITVIPVISGPVTDVETGVATGTTQLHAGSKYYLLATAVGELVGWRKNSIEENLSIFVSLDGGLSVDSHRFDTAPAFRINSSGEEPPGSTEGLIGETVTLVGRGQEFAGSAVFSEDFSTVTVAEPGVEFPSVAAFETPGSGVLLVDVAIDVGRDFLEIDFSNAVHTSMYAMWFFNGYSLRTDASSIVFTAASIDSDITTLGLAPSDVTFTENELFINMEGLTFDTSSVVRINFETMDDSVPIIEIKIQELYVGILGRAGDRPGLDYWRDQIEAGPFTLENTRAAFTDPAQTEYTEIYGGLGNTQLVSATYENFLERAPEQAGLSYWVGELDAGRVNPDQMINAVINAVQDPNATGAAAAKDLATLENKIAAAIYFTEKTGGYTFDAAYREMARQVVASVTDDADTLNQSKAMTDEYVGN